MNLHDLTFNDILASGYYQGAFQLFIYGLAETDGSAISATGTSDLNWINIDKTYGTCRFENCRVPVSLEKMAGLVKDIVVDKSLYGIQWRKSYGRDIAILDNDITSHRTGIWSMLSEPFQQNSLTSHGRIVGNIVTGQKYNYNYRTSGIKLNEGMGGDNGWFVEDNTLTLEEPHGIGIFADHSAKSDFLNNTIKYQGRYGSLNHHPILVGIVSHGMLLQGTSGARLIENDITGSSESDANAGIQCTATSGSYLECNKTRGSQHGIWMLDLNGGAELTTNEFYTAEKGLVYGNETFLETNIGVQIYEGNIWEEGTVKLGGENFSSSPEDNLFLVDQEIEGKQRLPAGMTFFATNNTDVWFEDKYFPPLSEYCYPPFIGESNCRDFDAFDEKIALNQMEFNSFQDAGNFRTAYRLLQKIAKYDPCDDIDIPVIYDDFYRSKTSTAVGQLAWVKLQMDKVLVLNEIDEAARQDFLAELSLSSATVLEFDQSLQDGQTIDSEEYERAIAQYEIQLTAYEVFSARIQQQIHQKCASLVALNEAIEGIADYVINQQAVNRIKLAILMGNDDILLEEENLLKNIANQCPLSGGDAVYEARALLFNDEAYEDAISCVESVERYQKSEPVENVILLPNPTTGAVFLSGLVDKKCKISVFNSLGRLVLQTEGSSFDLAKNPPGVYRVYVEVEGQRAFNKTLILSSIK